MAEERAAAVERLLNEGAKLFESGHADQAIAVWTEVLHLAPGEPRAIEYLHGANASHADVEKELLHTGTTSRAELEHLLRERKYEEALEILYAARRQNPEATALARGIQLLKQRLVRRYLHRLGNLDHVPRSTRVDDEMPLAEETRGVLRLVDGISSFGDIARESRLGRFETYRMLARLVDEGLISAHANAPAKEHIPFDPKLLARKRRAPWLLATLTLVGAAAAVGALVRPALQSLPEPARSVTESEPAAGPPESSAPVPSALPVEPPAAPPQVEPAPAPSPAVEAAPAPKTPPPAPSVAPTPTRQRGRLRGNPRGRATIGVVPAPLVPQPAAAPAPVAPAPISSTAAVVMEAPPPPPLVATVGQPVGHADPAPPEAPPPEAKPAPPPEPKPAPPPRPPPPPPREVFEARVGTTGLSVAGGLPRAAVERAVDRATLAFRACYVEAAQRAGRNASGAVDVKLVFDETGQAREANVGAAPLPGLGECVRQVARRIRSQAPDVGEVRVSFTVTFTPRGS